MGPSRSDAQRLSQGTLGPVFSPPEEAWGCHRHVSLGPHLELVGGRVGGRPFLWVGKWEDVGAATRPGPREVAPQQGSCPGDNLWVEANMGSWPPAVPGPACPALPGCPGLQPVFTPAQCTLCQAVHTPSGQGGPCWWLKAQARSCLFVAGKTRQTADHR